MWNDDTRDLARTRTFVIVYPVYEELVVWNSVYSECYMRNLFGIKCAEYMPKYLVLCTFFMKVLIVQYK